jgi:hypothetical protein
MSRFKSATELVQREGFFWGDNVSATYFDVAEHDLDGYWARVIGPFIDDIQYEI